MFGELGEGEGGSGRIFRIEHGHVVLHLGE